MKKVNQLLIFLSHIININEIINIDTFVSVRCCYFYYIFKFYKNYIY